MEVTSYNHGTGWIVACVDCRWQQLCNPKSSADDLAQDHVHSHPSHTVTLNEVMTVSADTFEHTGGR